MDFFFHLYCSISYQAHLLGFVIVMLSFQCTSVFSMFIVTWILYIFQFYCKDQGLTLENDLFKYIVPTAVTIYISKFTNLNLWSLLWLSHQFPIDNKCCHTCVRQWLTKKIFLWSQTSTKCINIFEKKWNFFRKMFPSISVFMDGVKLLKIKTIKNCKYLKNWLFDTKNKNVGYS